MKKSKEQKTKIERKKSMSLLDFMKQKEENKKIIKVGDFVHVKQFPNSFSGKVKKIWFNGIGYCAVIKTQHEERIFDDAVGEITKIMNKSNPTLDPKDNTQKQISNCCQAPMKVVGGDEGTNHYECSSCGKPCDIYTQKPSEEWEKELDNLLFEIFGKNEIEPGKFVIMPGRHYEIRKPLKQFIREAIQATREKTINEVLEEIEFDLKKFNAQEEVYGRMALVGLRATIREMKHKRKE